VWESVHISYLETKIRKPREAVANQKLKVAWERRGVMTVKCGAHHQTAYPDVIFERHIQHASLSSK
jgi:hypothetical protein